MDFSLSEEQQMLRDGAERYLSQHYDFEKRRAILASAARCDERHWRQFAELGWLALGLPEEVGGIGCTLIETALIMEVMGRWLVLEPYATTAILSARIVERSGNAAARAALLPELAAGSLRLALAHDESGFRQDAGALETKAQRDGAAFRLDGTKLLAYDAPNAHRLLVTAWLEVQGAPTIWLVDRDAPGVAIESYALIDGTRAADVVLQGVRLPPEALLAGPELAADVLEDALDRIVLGRVAEALGAMEAVMEMTAEYLRTRSQFGQPLAKFQALQHRMAEMFVEVQETRSILYRGLAAIDALPAERQAAVSAAKVVAAAAARVVGGEGIQLHGAIGMTEEYRVGHYFKRLMVLEKAFGDADYHLCRLSATSTRPERRPAAS